MQFGALRNALSLLEYGANPTLPAAVSQPASRSVPAAQCACAHPTLQRTMFTDRPTRWLLCVCWPWQDGSTPLDLARRLPRESGDRDKLLAMLTEATNKWRDANRPAAAAAANSSQHAQGAAGSRPASSSSAAAAAAAGEL